jgi:hypothetical protein
MRRVRLAGARRPEEHHAGGLEQEVQLRQVQHDLLAHRAFEGEVEVSRVLTAGSRAFLTRWRDPEVSRASTSSSNTLTR